MRVELEALHNDLGATMIYVTHDQVEAMTMADKIVVLNGGRIEQVGPPMELYHRPRTEFVAGFIGAPAMNIADIRTEGGTAIFGEARLALPAAAAGAARMGIRPEHIAIRAPGQGDIDVRVALKEALGGDSFLYADTAEGTRLVIRAEGETPVRSGDTIGVALPAERVHFFAADGRTLSSGGAPA
jgi:ABC-type sugar transport system ATPase subunit